MAVIEQTRAFTDEEWKKLQETYTTLGQTYTSIIETTGDTAEYSLKFEVGKKKFVVHKNVDEYSIGKYAEDDRPYVVYLVDLANLVAPGVFKVDRTLGMIFYCQMKRYLDAENFHLAHLLHILSYHGITYIALSNRIVVELEDDIVFFCHDDLLEMIVPLLAKVITDNEI